VLAGSGESPASTAELVKRVPRLTERSLSPAAKIEIETTLEFVEILQKPSPQLAAHFVVERRETRSS
jgi:hypothetical protein